MTLGTLVVDETILPIAEVRLAERSFIVRTEAVMLCSTLVMRADTQVKVFGTDGELIVTALYAGPGFIAHAGDRVEITQRFHVTDRLTEDAREAWV